MAVWMISTITAATFPVRAEMARLGALNAVAMAGGRTPPHPVNHPLDRSGKGVPG